MPHPVDPRKPVAGSVMGVVTAVTPSSNGTNPHSITIRSFATDDGLYVIPTSREEWTTIGNPATFSVPVSVPIERRRPQGYGPAKIKQVLLNSYVRIFAADTVPEASGEPVVLEVSKVQIVTHHSQPAPLGPGTAR